MRKPVIGVMGGSKASAEVCAQAQQLGSLVIRRGWVPLYDGRDTGVVTASTKGAKQAGGFVIGILPDRTTSKAVLESAPCPVLMEPVATTAEPVSSQMGGAGKDGKTTLHRATFEDKEGTHNVH